MGMTDADLRDAVDAAHRANRQGLKMLSHMQEAMTDPTVTLFMVTLQLAIASNDELVSLLDKRMSELSRELDFRRSLDGYGTESE